MLYPQIKVFLVALLMGVAAVAAGGEEDLIRVLQSGASRKEKADACLGLARSGTGAAVPALAGLLGDPELAHVARYALEPIPDPAVDKALRDALGSLKGNLLAGAIGSLGVRRDAAAVTPLAALLADADAAVAGAASRALGDIGTLEALRALEQALAQAPEGTRADLCEGLLRGADALAAGGGRDAAGGIYERLLAAQVPPQVHAAALRGAILARGEKGLPLLIESLKAEAYASFAAALRPAAELRGEEVSRALAGLLNSLPAERQALIVDVLSQRRDPAAVTALEALATGADSPLRVAAVRGLGQAGAASSVPVLAELAQAGDPPVAEAAQAVLAGLPGGAADAAILAMLEQADPRRRALAAGLAAQRRVRAALPGLLRVAADTNAAAREASLKALGVLAGPDEAAPLVELLVRAEAPEPVEKALTAMCSRPAAPDPARVVIKKALYGDLPDGARADVTDAVARLVKEGTLSFPVTNDRLGDPAQGIRKRLTVDYTVDGRPGSLSVSESETLAIPSPGAPAVFAKAFAAALPKAPPPARRSLLRLLRCAGGPEALAAVRAAAGDADAEVRDVAVRALCDWPDADAIPDLAGLAKAASDPKVKILALRGYLRLIPQRAGPAADTLAAVRDALSLAERPEEKRLALAVLGTIPTGEALELVKPSLADPELREEACRAAVGIAAGMQKPYPQAVLDVLRQVAGSAGDAQLRATAQSMAAP